MNSPDIEHFRELGLVDFHSHILPEMDDGSKSIEETMEMLNLSFAQGIAAMVATPHLYPDRESLDCFLHRREHSLQKLLRVYDEKNSPTVFLGAEVAYFPGISHSENVKELTVCGTNTILLEMPFCQWTDSVVEDVLSLRRFWGITPVIAHIERYEKEQKHGTIETLAENGVFIQSNSEHFLNPKTAKYAIRQCKHSLIHILGSDCHNPDSRPPELGKAFECVCRKLGRSYLESMSELEAYLLRGAIPISKMK